MRARSCLRPLTLAAALLLAAVGRGAAQAPARPPTSAADRASRTADDAMRDLPFLVGEHLEYDAKFGVLKAGRGYMEVVGLESVRGKETMHVTMRVSGGALGWKVRYFLDSWIEPRSFTSLRHVQDQSEGRNGSRQRSYEIFPDRGVFVEGQEPEEPTVARPLDDASFLYFVRTVPLLVGEVYEFDRYFRPDRNPVRVRVMRRERVKVPAGEFDAIVIQPVVKTKGLLSESARTEVWLSDDDRRLLLKMVAQLPVASLSLQLRSMSGTR